MLDTFPQKQVATPTLVAAAKEPLIAVYAESARPATSPWRLSPAAEPWSPRGGLSVLHLMEDGVVSGLLPIGEIALRPRIPGGRSSRVEGGGLC